MKNITTTLFTFGLIIAASFTAKAVTYTGDVTGQVIEQETKQPVAFAEVVFMSGKERITVIANEYGYYNAKHIPMGKYDLHIVFNNRNFTMNNVKVKDSYTARIDFNVSNSENLPNQVEITDAKSDKVAVNGIKAKNKPASIEPMPETSQMEAVKYGMVIQNGQIMIMRNKPVTLYA